jgi:hypothetical protein
MITPSCLDGETYGNMSGKEDCEIVGNTYGAIENAVNGTVNKAVIGAVDGADDGVIEGPADGECSERQKGS